MRLDCCGKLIRSGLLQETSRLQIQLDPSRPGGSQDGAPQAGGASAAPGVCQMLWARPGLGQGWAEAGNTRAALRDGSPGLTIGQGSDDGGGAEGDQGRGAKGGLGGRHRLWRGSAEAAQSEDSAAVGVLEREGRRLPYLRARAVPVLRASAGNAEVTQSGNGTGGRGAFNGEH